jgi:hypothetical protein
MESWREKREEDAEGERDFSQNIFFTLADP